MTTVSTASAQAWHEGVFAEDEPIDAPNPLADNKTYTAIGRDNSIEARPLVVHFGGFTVGSLHEQHVHLCNTSTSRSRVHVVLPTTPYFKAICSDKKGYLAPGMEDTVTIQFCPTEWRYYSDSLRVHTAQGGTVLIPIHAYPMMNQARFPKRVNFGKLGIGESTTKHVDLTCNVPIDFEFDITVIRPNAAFVIRPTQGIVPANGAVQVEVTFSPCRLVTELMEIEVHVAEFQSEPVKCTLSGSGFPGLARQQHLLGLTGSIHDPQPKWGKAEREHLVKPPGTGKGGAGGGDTYTRLLTQKKQEGGPRDSRVTGPIKAKLPVIRPPTPPSLLEGLVVPAHPNQQANMAMLLNQQPGKLMLTDIQVAIEEKKRQLAEKQATLRRTLGRSKGQSLDPLDDSSLPRQAKADLFEYLCLEQQQRRRDVELDALEPQVGSDTPTPQQVAQVQEARLQHKQQAAASQQQADMNRVTAEMEAAAATSIKPAGDAAAEQQAAEPQPSGKAAAANEVTPRWDVSNGDAWYKRQQALYRFVQAGRKVIYQNRAAKRLGLINKLVHSIKHGSGDTEAAAPGIDRTTTSLSPTHTWQPQTSRATPAAAMQLSISQVLPSLPVHRDAPFQTYQPVDAPQFSVDFITLEPLDLQVPEYHKLMGYEEEPFPALTPYAPPLLDLALEEGAIEETPWPHATGVEMPVSEWLTMPDSCLLPTHANLPIGNRYSTDKVHAQLGRSWGLDAGSAIQPREYSHPSAAELYLPESSSVRALAGQPMLTDLFVPFRQPQVWTTPEGQSAEALRRSLAADQAGTTQHTSQIAEAEIRKFLPADMEYIPEQSTSAATQSPAAHEGVGTATASVAAPQRPVKPTAAQQYGQQLDIALEARQQANLKRADARVAEYNATVKIPCWSALP